MTALTLLQNHHTWASILVYEVGGPVDGVYYPGWVVSQHTAVTLSSTLLSNEATSRDRKEKERLESQ